MILREQIVTSGRKAHTHSASHALWLFVLMLKPGALKRRDQLDFWYSGKRKAAGGKREIR